MPVPRWRPIRSIRLRSYSTGSSGCSGSGGTKRRPLSLSRNRLVVLGAGAVDEGDRVRERVVLGVAEGHRALAGDLVARARGGHLVGDGALAGGHQLIHRPAALLLGGRLISELPGPEQVECFERGAAAVGAAHLEAGHE